ncbi:Villin-4 [Platanthera guangdongensis]|uniref:Villin-4 n=1 Tax=Platanthera guangdongensis TaxID=2320717 RepID=A0ABR2M2C6_9ASPA
MPTLIAVLYSAESPARSLFATHAPWAISGSLLPAFLHGLAKSRVTHRQVVQCARRRVGAGPPVACDGGTSGRLHNVVRVVRVSSLYKIFIIHRSYFVANNEVWRVSGDEKLLLSSTEQSKFYSGDCYIFQYSFLGNDKEEYLLGTWFGKESTAEERAAAISLATKMTDSFKTQAVQVNLFVLDEF